jgi:hypothetical protein
MRRVTGSILAVLALAGAAAGRIDRLDFYDRADNLLLFTVLAYDSTGVNTGRTVYAPDSTYLRRTEIRRTSGGGVLREVSFNHIGDSVVVSTPGGTAGSPTVTVRDQFGLDLLGVPASFEPVSSGEYRVSQQGTHRYSITYGYNAGELSRVEITDPAGALVAYVVPSSWAAVAPRPAGTLAARPQVVSLGDGRFRVEMVLPAFARVQISVLGLDGRVRSRLLERGAAGSARFVVQVRDAPGACILEVAVNGEGTLTSHTPVVVLR